MAGQQTRLLGLDPNAKQVLDLNSGSCRCHFDIITAPAAHLSGVSRMSLLHHALYRILIPYLISGASMREGRGYFCSWV